MPYKSIDLKEMKEKMTLYKNQRKFQLSVVDFTPYFDWYFMLTILVLGIIVSGLAAFSVYTGIISEINSTPEINVAINRKMKTEILESLVDEYEEKAKNLNTLR